MYHIRVQHFGISCCQLELIGNLPLARTADAKIRRQFSALMITIPHNKFATIGFQFHPHCPQQTIFPLFGAAKPQAELAASLICSINASVLTSFVFQQNLLQLLCTDRQLHPPHTLLRQWQHFHRHAAEVDILIGSTL